VIVRQNRYVVRVVIIVVILLLEATLLVVLGLSMLFPMAWLFIATMRQKIMGEHGRKIRNRDNHRRISWSNWGTPLKLHSR